jgi:predicted TIM-barrel fold metal-dependent hydrolase
MQDPLMNTIARMFPHTTFIVHAGAFAAEHMADLDNVWFEVVQYPDGQGTEWDFNRLAERVGRERLIFGADLPYYDYRVLQATIENAEIDDDLKDRIAHRNMIDLIRKFKPDWEMPSTPVAAPRIYEPEQLWASNPRNPVRLTVYA